MSDEEIKVITGRPGRPKGVTVLSDRKTIAPGESGVEIIRSGVQIKEGPAIETQHEISIGGEDEGKDKN